MRVEIATTWEELTAVFDDWNRLARGVPFRSFPWLAGWWKHYGSLDKSSTRQLLVLLIRDNHGALRGVAPWYLEHSVAAGRVIKFLGSGEVFSDYLSLLSENGYETAVALRIAEFLDRDFHGQWDALELTGVDAHDPTVDDFLDAAAIDGNIVWNRPELNCWRIHLPSTWEEYLALVSKSHRKQLRRAERRLESPGWEVQSATTKAAMPAALEVLIELHQRRQESLGHAGCFASPQFTAFHRDVAPRLAAIGQARIDVVMLDGAPIAAEYQLLGRDVVYAYQGGVAPDRLDLEPGRLVMQFALRRAIRTGYQVYDFLRGDEPYKHHWRAVARETLRARVGPSRRIARIRNSWWLARDVAKSWAKEHLRSQARI